MPDDNHYVIEHLTCSNDTNGNPRRAYIVREVSGAARRVWAFDEGYQGWGAIPIYFINRTLIEYSTPTTPAHRREMLREFSALALPAGAVE
jgi:hypothetical protein